MKVTKLSPEQASINLDINSIENQYFVDVKNPAHRRGEAFQYLCYSITSIIDTNEIEDEDIIDGKDEEGIDIISITETNDDMVVNILNCKSSFVDNFSANDLNRLKNGLQYIFEEPLSIVDKQSNIKLKYKINQIRSNSYKIQKINVYYCVYNGSKLEPNVTLKVKEIINRYKKFIKNQYPNADFNLELLGSKNLFNIKSRNLESLRNKVVILSYYDSEKMAKPEIITDEGTKGYITTIRAEEIGKLINKYGDKLFEKNIRGWLKFNKKNKEIYNSCISDESRLFWFLNNGITIIGDKVLPNDHESVWKITNLQIVNGQQTARMIYEAWKEKKLKSNVTLMCRIYETSENRFINKITKATNSQSSIGSRDLMSNDSKQIALQKYFNNYNYFYERQKGENRPHDNYKQSFTSKKLAQISLGILCKKPSLARKNIEDNFFNPQKFYNKIFDKNPDELLIAYLLYKYCDDLKDDKDEYSYFGVLHIARIMWEYLFDELSKDYKKSISDFEKNQLKIKKEYNMAKNNLNKLIKKEIKDNNLGNYLSRIEVDEMIYRNFSLGK